MEGKPKIHLTTMKSFKETATYQDEEVEKLRIGNNSEIAIFMELFG